jgi:integrase
LKFPKRIKHRGKELATIYGRSKSYPQYRVAWSVAGQRRMKAFAHYGGKDGALAFAETLVVDLAKGSQVSALTPAQARDALGALQQIQAFYQRTGRTVSLLVAASEYCAATEALGGQSLAQCVDVYRRNLAVVKRKDLAEAVAEFTQGREKKTIALEGKRPQLSAHYCYNVTMWLKEFAGTFPGHAVCDLTKEHLNAYMAMHTKVGPKTRNERRNVVKMFLKWAVRQNYIAAHHRLLEADSMTKEQADPDEIAFYSPAELQTILENATAVLCPVLALVALGGVRSQEAVRLTWEDVFGTPGHIVVKVSKSKTRSRRLTTICPSLAAWLEPYRECSGPIWPKGIDMLQEDFKSLRDDLHIPAKRNGLRHGFVSSHYALHSNENLTAAEAGNSPQIIHRNYKGLATKAEAEKWFAVAPKQVDNVIQMAAVKLTG